VVIGLRSVSCWVAFFARDADDNVFQNESYARTTASCSAESEGAADVAVGEEVDGAGES
jgi:hypothetical protein